MFPSMSLLMVFISIMFYRMLSFSIFLAEAMRSEVKRPWILSAYKLLGDGMRALSTWVSSAREDACSTTTVCVGRKRTMVM